MSVIFYIQSLFNINGEDLMNKVCTYLIVGNLFVLGAVSTYGNDVDVVKTILEKCGMSETPIADVAVVENGQVVSLNLNNKDISQDGIAELPPDIGKLAALRELSVGSRRTSC